LYNRTIVKRVIGGSILKAGFVSPDRLTVSSRPGKASAFVRISGLNPAAVCRGAPNASSRTQGILPNSMLSSLSRSDSSGVLSP
jgi:hypothetical protein